MTMPNAETMLASFPRRASLIAHVTDPARAARSSLPIAYASARVIFKGSFTMSRNVGTIDRVMRIGVGLTLIALAATGTVGAWGYTGVGPLLTAFIGDCPAYSLGALNTCPLSDRKA